MDFCRCKGCKKFFGFPGFHLCSECEYYFIDAIRKYTDENGAKDRVELNNALDIPLDVIDYLCKKGLVTVSDDEEIENNMVNINTDIVNDLKQMGTLLKIDKDGKKGSKPSMHFFTEERRERRR